MLPAMETYAERTRTGAAAGALATCPSAVPGRAGALGAAQAAVSSPSVSRVSGSEARPFTMTLLSCGRAGATSSRTADPQYPTRERPAPRIALVRGALVLARHEEGQAR